MSRASSSSRHRHRRPVSDVRNVSTPSIRADSAEIPQPVQGSEQPRPRQSPGSVSSSRPIRVLLVIPTLDRSGAEKSFALLATRLPKETFAVRAVALDRSGPYAEMLEKQGIPLDVLHKRGKLDPIALWRLRRVIADWQPDIVHTWLFAANAYGRMLAGGPVGPRVIVSEQCVDTWKRRWQLWLDRRQIPRTDYLVGNSQSVARFYRDLGYPAEKVKVIPNGVEVPDPLPDTRADVLRELELPPDARLMLYVGRLAVQKRVEDLIWAIELLRQVDERAWLIVVGDGPERYSLEKFARDTQCDHRIRFLGHRSDIGRLLPACDVFWLASAFEGLSNSLMEAMAHGLAVVVSDIPPNRELVTDGETGLLVPLGDRAAFARRTADLLADPQQAHRLGAAARERMRREFPIERMVQSYAALYRDVVADSSAS